MKITLDRLRSGDYAQVADHCDKTVSERLTALGFGVGADFQVVRAGKRGVTVRVGEAKFGLNTGLATTIVVEKK